jgi:hypothetical protein
MPKERSVLFSFVHLTLDSMGSNENQQTLRNRMATGHPLCAAGRQTPAVLMQLDPTYAAVNDVGLALTVETEVAGAGNTRTAAVVVNSMPSNIS